MMEQVTSLTGGRRQIDREREGTRILGMFRGGQDTLTIALAIDLPEPFVVKLLGHTREVERGLR